MPKYLLVVVIIVLFPGCGSKKTITDHRDYNMYLDRGIIKEKKQSLKSELSFWQNRLQKDTGNCVDMMKLASCHLRLFKFQGTIEDLHTGDSLLKRSSDKLQHTDPDMLFSLSQNTITRHRFREAAALVAAASRAGGDQYTTRLLEFDTKLELGEMMMAERSIGSIKDRDAFDYLVRKSKLEDHKGNLDQAIRLMEQAFEKIKNNNKELYCWALSNLGDMYGHAGKVQDAYNAYLQVLQQDNSYIYALKGIAWIAYSHDRNSVEAKRIYELILSETNMPDLWLLLAEIAEWEGDLVEKDRYIRCFRQEVEQPAYGNMYNKYLVQLYVEEMKDYNKALGLAEKEIQQRATPETYDWLAWVHFNKGNIKEAKTIAINYVYNRNFEPEALLHTAIIFSATGEKTKARELLEECLASSFELGPVKTEVVKKLLKSL